MKLKFPKLNLFTGIVAVIGVAVVGSFIMKNNNKNAMIAKSYYVVGPNNIYYQSLNETLAQGQYTSQIQMATNADGRREIFVRGTDGALWHAWERSPGSSQWSKWYSLGGVIPTRFYLTRSPQGGIAVITLGTSGLYYINSQVQGWNGWNWSDWQPIGGGYGGGGGY